MKVVIISFNGGGNRVIGPFASDEEAFEFEKRLVAKIKADENIAVSPIHYITPADGWYVADFNSAYHPDLPVQIRTDEVLAPEI